MAPVTLQEKSTKMRKKYQKLVLKSTVHRSITTSDNKKLWFTFPNLEHVRKISLSRKLLHLNYAFGAQGNHPAKRIKYPSKDWYASLENFKKKNYFQCQLPQRKLKGSVVKSGTRTDRNILTRNIMTYGIPRDKAAAAAKYANTSNTPEVERFLCKIVNDSGVVTPTKFNIWPTINSTDVVPPTSSDEPLEDTSLRELPDEVASCSGTSIRSDPPLRRQALVANKYKKTISKLQDVNSAKNPIPEEHTDQWQMQNWLKPLQKEYFQVEINEIWYNRRLRGKRTDPIAHKQKLTPPVAEILIEILRKAYFHQEWFKVAKAIEGLCNEASTPASAALGHSRNWIFWNAGFYSIMRFENTLDGASFAIQKFARNFHGMFAPRTYPRRLGVEVAIWLTQEGRFLEGLKFMEEMNILGINPRSAPGSEAVINNRIVDKTSSSNPKRDLIDFLFHLIRAVHLYALYQRDNSLIERGLLMDDETNLRAELALSAFESLLEYSNKCEGEITTFLDHLIQLTIKCRSLDRAKQLFEEIVVKYYGNVFVERAYLKFLSEYFHQEKNDMGSHLEIKNKFNFTTNPSHWQHQGRAIAAYRRRKLEFRDNVKMSFNQVENPGFSW